MKYLKSVVCLAVLLDVALCTPLLAQAPGAIRGKLASKSQTSPMFRFDFNGLAPPGHPINDWDRSRKIPSVYELNNVHFDQLIRKRFQVVLSPSKAFEGVDGPTAEDLAEYLGQMDFVPADRARHFAWCADGKTFINGWIGMITEIVPVERGWKVEVSTYPSLCRYGARILSTTDRVRETYLIERSGRLNFIRAEAVHIEGYSGIIEM